MTTLKLMTVSVLITDDNGTLLLSRFSSLLRNLEVRPLAVTLGNAFGLTGVKHMSKHDNNIAWGDNLWRHYSCNHSLKGRLGNTSPGARTQSPWGGSVCSLCAFLNEKLLSESQGLCPPELCAQSYQVVRPSFCLPVRLLLWSSLAVLLSL